MFGTIICGVDNSGASHSAARFTARLGNQLNMRTVLVHVAEHAPVVAPPIGGHPKLSGVGLGLETSRELEREGRRLVERLAREEGLEDAEPRVVVGAPAASLAAPYAATSRPALR